MTVSGKTAGKRAVKPPKLTRDKPALLEIVGERRGRKTERETHAKQDRLKRVQPFKAGMAT